MGLGVHAAARDGRCGIGHGARHTGDVHVPRHAPVQGDGCLGGDRHHGEMGLGGSSERAEPRSAGVPRDMDCCRSYRIDRCHLLCLLQSTGLGNFVGRCRRIHEIHLPGLRGFREALFQHDDKRHYDRSGQGKARMVQVQGCCRLGRQLREPSGHRPDQCRCRESPAGDHRRSETGCGQCRESQGIARWNQPSLEFRTVARRCRREVENLAGNRIALPARHGRRTGGELSGRRQRNLRQYGRSGSRLGHRHGRQALHDDQYYARIIGR